MCKESWILHIVRKKYPTKIKSMHRGHNVELVCPCEEKTCPYMERVATLLSNCMNIFHLVKGVNEESILRLKLAVKKRYGPCMLDSIPERRKSRS